MRIAVDELTPGAKVMGTTIAELGNMNRPLDMIAYRKDGGGLHPDGQLQPRRDEAATPTNLGDYGPITDKIAATHGVPYETVDALEGVRRLDQLTTPRRWPWSRPARR